jgi:xanthine dehydrogenase accessory factor
MFDISEHVDSWLSAGMQTAIATVVETWGSAPRRVGAKLAVTADTAMIGSVSGGCVETAVIEEMIDSLADRRPRLLSFGVSDDVAWGVGLACGGQITIYAEPLDVEWWRLLNQHSGQHFTTVTVLAGQHAGVKLLKADENLYFHAATSLPEKLSAALRTAADCPESTRFTHSDYDLLVEVYHPQPTLVIIGGSHVAIALNRYAEILGFRVVVIDPRRTFASKERFPDVALLSHEYPDEALSTIELNRQTYVTILSHDPKIDDPALKTVLPLDVAYIGVLSSRRTHAKRVERLTEGGIDPALLNRIHTPIGLNIHARTPEEVALSIMAEIISIRNGGKL